MLLLPQNSNYLNVLRLQLATKESKEKRESIRFTVRRRSDELVGNYLIDVRTFVDERDGKGMVGSGMGINVFFRELEWFAVKMKEMLIAKETNVTETNTEGKRTLLIEYLRTTRGFFKYFKLSVMATEAQEKPFVICIGMHNFKSFTDRMSEVLNLLHFCEFSQEEDGSEKERLLMMYMAASIISSDTFPTTIPATLADQSDEIPALIEMAKITTTLNEKNGNFYQRVLSFFGYDHSGTQKVALKDDEWKKVFEIHLQAAVAEDADLAKAVYTAVEHAVLRDEYEEWGNK